VALIDKVPLGKVEVVTVATPDAFNVAVPMDAVPLLKVTLPVGMPLPEVTVAVNVTDWWNVEGFGVDTTEVVVVTLLTTWLRTGEVLVASLVSPL
jgi:hypothetical protein